MILIEKHGGRIVVGWKDTLTLMVEYYVYRRLSCPEPDSGKVSAGVGGDVFVHIWRPTLRNPFYSWEWRSVVCSVFHFLRVFKNRGYCVAFVKCNGRIVHISSVIPAYFRFPFMSADDLQISSTWTCPWYRNRGIATAVLARVARLGRDGLPVTLWYTTRAGNPASIAVCKKAGFELLARAKRETRFRLLLLGAFTLTEATHLQANRLAEVQHENVAAPCRRDHAIAAELSFARAIREYLLPISTSLVLDMGCGGDDTLYWLLRIGFAVQNIRSLDILSDCVTWSTVPPRQDGGICSDDCFVEAADCRYDLVCGTAVFATIADGAIAEKMALEMTRVCKVGGYILLLDWRRQHWFHAHPALTPHRLGQLFQVGVATEMIGLYRGALIPSLGRLLAKHFPGSYSLVTAAFPFLVGQVTYLLRKIK